VVLIVIAARIVASTFVFRDFTLSWSKATSYTFLIKSVVYLVAFFMYMPFFYGDIHLYFFVSELFTYLFAINLLMYGYRYYINKSNAIKDKIAVIYGAGRAGLKLEEELRYSKYKVKCFIDDNTILNGRSIDGIPIYSKDNFLLKIKKNKLDLLVIAMPSANRNRVEEIYNKLHSHFNKIQILPSINNILQDKPYSTQLRDISVSDLLARRPKDLDKEKIASFIQNKTILITGAGGSIGSEISRQCVKYGAKELILLDHSEFNLYSIEQELSQANIKCIMQSVVNKELLDKTFKKYRPDIVLHAAAYKHVPLCEENIEEAILNNIIGTKNTIDLSCKYEVEKFVLISTDKAVRPTNVMGATKRVCELYAQNTKCKTEIVAVRFGNVLGSSGSVIPKFKEQIKNGGPITVTHPEITRYFMLIPEACELVLQAASIGKGGEIFILDMGEPIKIVDLAKKMIELSGSDNIKIEFTGLRAGEKLYEELLINESDKKTEYESIMVGKITYYDIDKLNNDIIKLLKSDNKLDVLKEIVPEFNRNN
jgi:FlaA1/EpsC-like NDP-sugar epimerase